jgi:hypothetical protein
MNLDSEVRGWKTSHFWGAVERKKAVDGGGFVRMLHKPFL